MAILTLSRLYGSGGSEVAALTARLLGWSLLDNAVVDAVAARMGLSVAEVRDREERVPSLVERLTSAMAMGSQEWMSPIAAANRPTDEQLIEVTRHIIEEAIVRGPVVVVGRGAQEMLAAREDALHVFCYAPRKALIARTMQREGVDVEEATRLVDSTNKERDQWVRLHWERDRRAHENYDLSVNT
ncbi:MAG: cytidylate kinase-like family protein, partial [Gemmatimonadota bacterium]|nr:cytidylate kinase-like family protein [Gemmatimonadota bacterium]